MHIQNKSRTFSDFIKPSGLAWNWDGLQFASGANDNLSCVYNVDADLVSPTRPRHSFTHDAAVKALAFCPWQENLLAAGSLSPNIDSSLGGGSQDQRIRFFDTRTGHLLATLDTGAQVTAILWSIECTLIME